MKLKFATLALTGLTIALPILNAVVVPFSVPGTSNIWLAGQPGGTTLAGDWAPAHSPVPAGITLTGGNVLTFSASGSVGYPGEPAGPDGASAGSHGANFGLSGVTANWNALLAVFITDAVPGGVAPASLNFSPAGLTRDFASLSPLLNQVFFIGDGVTSGAVVQQFIVPAGATRLFLGTLDGSGWFNNTGSFSGNITFTPVTASVPDESSTAILLGVTVLGLGIFSRRRSIA